MKPMLRYAFWLASLIIIAHSASAVGEVSLVASKCEMELNRTTKFLGTVVFHERSKTLDDTMKLHLMEIGNIITQNNVSPPATIVLVGYTDGNGTSTANRALSLRRAKFVQKRLKQSVAAGLTIEVAACGDRHPVVPNVIRRPEPNNNRVDVRIR